jgi:hypothetical protein
MQAERGRRRAAGNGEHVFLEACESKKLIRGEFLVNSSVFFSSLLRLATIRDDGGIITAYSGWHSDAFQPSCAALKLVGSLETVGRGMSASSKIIAASPAATPLEPRRACADSNDFWWPEGPLRLTPAGILTHSSLRARLLRWRRHSVDPDRYADLSNGSISMG